MLDNGTRLGPYEIVTPLGAGGMGEVYRAQDTKLGRDVAIKVLPEEFTQHSERLARFDREARFLASLNHPGIATLHGLENFEGKPFLVMELVEGETLAERIARGPIPVKEAMALAQQIAEALEAAHEKGVIHRDLKPANIKVDAEGRVKILDFGLAKAFGDELPESDLSQSPTLSRDATGRGVILGTAVYMSPEQARGKAVDKRTDIFSFGAVLYEMLSGKKAFLGEDVQEVLANVIKGEPDWKALPANTPPSVSALVQRCLTKDRKQRLQAIGESRIAAERYLAAPDAEPSDTVKTRAPVLAWAVAAISAIAFVTTFLVQTPSTPRPPVRLSMDLGTEGLRLADPSEVGNPRVVLSPDGRTLAFVGQRDDGQYQIYVRSLDQLEPTPLAGTEDAYHPFFSPDGQYLAFFAREALRKVSVMGGVAMSLAQTGPGRGGTWGPDDTIVYGTPTNALYRVSAAGGTPAELTTLNEGEFSHRFPTLLPNGRAVVFTVTSGAVENRSLQAVLLDTGERKALHRGGSFPRYVVSGHLLFAHNRTLFAMPFDADRIEPTGEPSPVIEGIRDNASSADFAVADDGTLVYVPDTDALNGGSQLVRVDREGKASLLTDTIGDWESPRFSPDGQRIAVRRTGDQQDVWILEPSRGTMQRLTFEEGLRPLWSPDATTVFFASNRAGPYNIFSKPADGSGSAQQLTRVASGIYPASITSDGKTLVFRGNVVRGNMDIGVLRLEGDGEPEMLLETEFDEHTPKLSPDDQWLAYVSNESGRDEVYLTRFPPSGKWQISTEGGTEPMWSRDNRELFYRNGEKMMVVDVSEGADQPGRPTLLFEGPYQLKIGPGATNYDVTPDGQGFVMIRPAEGLAESMGPTHVTLVLNWFEELKRLVPTE